MLNKRKFFVTKETAEFIQSFFYNMQSIWYRTKKTAKSQVRFDDKAEVTEHFRINDIPLKKLMHISKRFSNITEKPIRDRFLFLNTLYFDDRSQYIWNSLYLINIHV